MGASGTVSLTFGALPGSSDASVAVTGQSTIGSGSLPEAWVLPIATSDHTADEHVAEGLRLYTGNVIAGTGFTVYAVHDHGDTTTGKDHFAWGTFNVAWAWV
jgi:hypothetical protein